MTGLYVGLAVLFVAVFFVVRQSAVHGAPKVTEAEARALGLALHGDVARGHVEGVEIEVASTQRGFVVSAPAPTDVSLGRDTALPLYRTGDENVDQHVVARGDAVRLAAALDGETRVHVRELCVPLGRGAVAEGRVVRRVDSALARDLGAVRLSIRTVAAVSAALAAPPTAARIAAIARADLLAGVRRQALATLVTHFPEEAREVARALIADRDGGVREVARGLLAVEAGRLSVPEGPEGAVTLADEAGGLFMPPRRE